jgi:hypothetical protein
MTTLPLGVPRLVTRLRRALVDDSDPPQPIPRAPNPK